MNCTLHISDCGLDLYLFNPEEVSLLSKTKSPNSDLGTGMGVRGYPGATTREEGHVKFCPYKKGGEKVLAMLKGGGGGTTSFVVVFTLT